MLKKTIQIVFLLLKSIALLYIISFIVLIFYLKTGIFDERKVNTEYVGKIATEPPLADIYPRGHIPGVYFVMGEKLKYHLENEMGG